MPRMFRSIWLCGGDNELGEPQWLKLLFRLARETEGRYRTKLTFAGGEPMLLPFIARLAAEARELGFIVCIITNGSLLTERAIERLVGAVDWVGISVDALDEKTNTALGRHVDGSPIPEEKYLAIAGVVRAAGIRLKINTVVSNLNVREDFTDFIARAEPDRWKVMQMLVVGGQNDAAKPLAIGEEEFRGFVERHRCAPNLVVEDAGSMIGSYAMVDPRGRPYGNAGGSVRYGKPILEAGFLNQLPALGYRREATERRGGFYYAR